MKNNTKWRMLGVVLACMHFIVYAYIYSMLNKDYILEEYGKLGVWTINSIKENIVLCAVAIVLSMLSLIVPILIGRIYLILSRRGR